MGEDSIGKLAAQVSVDMSDFRTGLDSGRADVERFKQGVSGKSKMAMPEMPKMPDMGGLGEGLKAGASLFAGPLLAGTAALASISGIKSFVSEMVSSAKIVRRQAEDMGVSTETYQKLGLSAQRAGQDMESVAAGAAKMQKSIADAAEKGGPAADAFKRLGLSAKELLTMSTEEQMTKIAKGIVSIGNGALRTQAEMEIFGKAGKKLEDVLKDLAGGMDKYNGKILSDQAIQTFASVGKTAKEAWGSIKASIGEGAAALIRSTGLVEAHAKTQAEITAELRKEAQARREAVEVQERQVAAAKRQKEIEEGRQFRQKGVASLNDQIDALARGSTPEGKQFDALRKSARDEYSKSAEDAANRRGSKPDLAAMRKYWSAIEDANRAYEANIALIDQAGAKLAETKRKEQEGKEHQQQLKKDQQEAAALMEQQLSARQKQEQIEAKIAGWVKRGSIDQTSAAAMLARSRQDFAQNERENQARDSQAKLVNAHEKGTMDEYTERMRLQQEAEDRLARGKEWGQGGQGADPAAEAQKEVADNTAKIATSGEEALKCLREVVRKIGDPAPVWQGS